MMLDVIIHNANLMFKGNQACNSKFQPAVGLDEELHSVDVSDGDLM